MPKKIYLAALLAAFVAATGLATLVVAQGPVIQADDDDDKKKKKGSGSG